MAIEVGGDSGGSPWLTLPPPTPKNIVGGYYTELKRMPHAGTLVNNIEFPNTSFESNGEYEGYLNASLVWTLDVGTDIAAAIDTFITFGTCAIYDNTSDRLYCVAVDTTTTPDTLYTFFIVLETGAGTLLGSGQLTNTPVNIDGAFNCAVSRATVSSGNITLKFTNMTVVIDSTDGSIVSDTLSENVTNGELPGPYTTEDGLISIGTTVTTTTTLARMTLTRSGQTVVIPMANLMGINSDGASTWFVAWGDEVRLIASTSDTGKPVYRAWIRSEFDAWIKATMDQFGAP